MITKDNYWYQYDKSIGIITKDNYWHQYAISMITKDNVWHQFDTVR